LTKISRTGTPRKINVVQLLRVSARAKADSPAQTPIAKPGRTGKAAAMENGLYSIYGWAISCTSLKPKLLSEKLKGPTIYDGNMRSQQLFLVYKKGNGSLVCYCALDMFIDKNF
jgi:hypothetical protein